MGTWVDRAYSDIHKCHQKIKLQINTLYEYSCKYPQQNTSLPTPAAYKKNYILWGQMGSITGMQDYLTAGNQCNNHEGGLENMTSSTCHFPRKQIRTTYNARLVCEDQV